MIFIFAILFFCMILNRAFSRWGGTPTAFLRGEGELRVDKFGKMLYDVRVSP